MALDPARRERLFNIVLTVLLVAAIIEVGLLIRQNRSLRAQLESRMQEAGRAGPDIGSKAAGLEVTDPQGTRERIQFEGESRPTLVLVASAECPACAETLPIWKKILDEAPAGKLRIVALTQEDPAALMESFRKAGLGPPVYQVSREQAMGPWKMVFVPLTVLVDAAGVVRKSWTGVLPEDAVSDLTSEVRKL